MSERPEHPSEQSDLRMTNQAPPNGASTGTKRKPAPELPKVDRLPPYRILLHNDDVNTPAYVVDSICDLTPLSPHRAARIMLEAHNAGVALMLTTHRERAELYVDQFTGKGLTVTMEADK